MATIYHYTKGYNYSNIVLSGILKREGEAGRYANSTLAFFRKSKVERQVWFTTESEMPFTSMPGIGKTLGVNEFASYQAQRDRGYAAWQHLVGGVFRFVFDSDAIRAVRYFDGVVRSKLKKRGMLKSFEGFALSGNDDLSQWYHVNHDVSILLAQRVESWRKNDGWCATNLDLSFLRKVHA